MIKIVILLERDVRSLIKNVVKLDFVLGRWFQV